MHPVSDAVAASNAQVDGATPAQAHTAWSLRRSRHSSLTTYPDAAALPVTRVAAFRIHHTGEVFVPHPNARLTIHGRRLLVDRVRAGRPVAHVADEMGISRATAYKWVRRWRTEGDTGLHDRSSRPLTTPHRTPVDASASCGANGRSAPHGSDRFWPCPPQRFIAFWPATS
ncbi:hypothetical protein GCM10022222_84470 [Amycolatopsis ultiminotia]|uniref:DNA-binding domain-containing protein n=1 Tax=Amycolatopsis ultiminotia TaxID=543629 RepID=A0ABP6YSP1_9PSEU